VANARALGLGPGRTALRIVLPLAGRGLWAGAALAFGRALGEFGATLMLAGNIPGRTQTLSLAVYDAAASGDDALAGELSLAMLAVAVTVLGLAALLERRRW
jgi:molybdate transport system permease protein